MSLTLRTTLGCTEAVIDDDGGLKLFYQVADILSVDLHLKFTHKEDDFDAIDWEFNFHGHSLTLHYSIYTGISIFPSFTAQPGSFICRQLLNWQLTKRSLISGK